MSTKKNNKKAGEKVCCRCRKSRSNKSFSLCTSARDGLLSRCRQCEATRQAEKRTRVGSKKKRTKKSAKKSTKSPAKRTKK